MWWGPAVEAPGPGLRARFYAQLLDWPVVHGETGTTVLAALPGPSFLVSQQATDYWPPVWPPVEGQQRPMVHLDFQVGDLDTAVADAWRWGRPWRRPSPRTTSGCCWTRPVTPCASSSRWTDRQPRKVLTSR